IYVVFALLRLPSRSALVPYATLFRSERKAMITQKVEDMINTVVRQIAFYEFERKVHVQRRQGELTSEQLGQLWLSVQEDSLGPRSEEHTSELQSREKLVCRLLLEKKN